MSSEADHARICECGKFVPAWTQHDCPRLQAYRVLGDPPQPPLAEPKKPKPKRRRRKKPVAPPKPPPSLRVLELGRVSGNAVVFANSHGNFLIFTPEHVA